MSFTQDTLSKSSTGYAHKVSGQEWLYSSTTDSLDTIKADGYFDIVASLFAVGETLNVGDDSFDRDLIEIIEINPTAPKVKTRPFVGSGSIPDGSITTEKLADLAVTTAKLDNESVTIAKLEADLQPAAVIIFSELRSTTSGSATELFSFPGTLTTDNVLVQMRTSGFTASFVVNALVVTDGTVEVEFSGNPGDNHVMFFQITRVP